MLAAWARFVFRWRLAVLGACAVVLAVATFVLSRGGHLTTGTIGDIEAEEEAAWAGDVLRERAGPSFVAIFRSDTWTFDEPEFVSAMDASLEGLSESPEVTAIVTGTTLELAAPGLAQRFVSRDRHAALAIVTLRGDLNEAGAAYPKIRAKLQSGPLVVRCTGSLPYRHDLDTTLEHDLLVAESVSLPLALFVLLFVFRSAVAALLPVGVGALSVLSGIACVLALSRVTDMPAYAINVASLIGLGVAIDYSLFYVSRFREELAAGSELEHALVRAMQTAGRAVAFSGVAVGIGLAGLLFFPRSYLSAMGIAGALVVGFSIVFALSFLPALVGVLGRHVDAGALPFRRKSAGTDDPDDLWRRFVPRVMRMPILVLVPTLAFIIVLGLPFLRLRVRAAYVAVLPTKTEARATYDTFVRDFPEASANRIEVAVRFPGDALEPARIQALREFRDLVAKLPGVSRTESLFDVLDALPEQNALLALPRADWPRMVSGPLEASTRDGVTLVQVSTSGGPESNTARELVRVIRRHRAVGDGRLLVGGQTAMDLDSVTFMEGHSPGAIAFVVTLTSLVLFVLLRSVVLPLKAIVMNLLSIAASFGALVWIFQEGHLRTVLRFEPGPIEPTLPVLLFCVLYGLSMDYEVLLLSRMQEEWEQHHDNTRAVVEGLARSGRLITSAAAIMVAVFAAFALASVIMVKAMGVGMAIAVALDATLVRLLVVPATMRLFGDLNWWSPFDKNRSRPS
jgi:RND superfamily putative drug exporter